MKDLFHEIRRNLPSILKSTVIRMTIAGIVVAFLNHYSYHSLSSFCCLAALVFLYSAWNQYLGMNGVGPRPLGNGGFINAFVSNSDLRDDNYNAVSSAIMDAADFNLLIANLLAALIFVAIAAIDFMR